MRFLQPKNKCMVPVEVKRSGTATRHLNKNECNRCMYIQKKIYLYSKEKVDYIRTRNKVFRTIQQGVSETHNFDVG